MFAARTIHMRGKERRHREAMAKDKEIPKEGEREKEIEDLISMVDINIIYDHNNRCWAEKTHTHKHEHSCRVKKT